MDTKQPEALRIADDLHHSIAHYGAEDAFTFAAYEAGQRVRALPTENESLRTGYAAARLEIESLRERVQQLGQLARDVNSRRVTELEVQLAAVGAGGVEPLRKRCLHQITEPDHFAESVIDALKAIAVESAVFSEIQKGIDASHPANDGEKARMKKAVDRIAKIMELYFW